MKNFEEKRVGFDVKDSPFGELTDDSAQYSLGYDNFTLSTFCDGYIFQKHFSEYEGCTVDTLFITENNFQEAKDNIPSLKARKQVKSPADFINVMKLEANMKLRFIELE